MGIGQGRWKIGRRAAAAGPTLGRAFAVVEEVWPLDSDPRTTEPDRAVLASRRTAAEAADLAREAVAGFRRSGYHKPSRSWWGATETTFHRFRVNRANLRAGGAVVLVTGLTVLAALALSRKRKR